MMDTTVTVTFASLSRRFYGMILGRATVLDIVYAQP